jgi:hypothetical protein
MLGCNGTPPSGLGTTLGIAPHSLTSDWVSTCRIVRGGVSGGETIGGSNDLFCAMLNLLCVRDATAFEAV